MQRESEEQADIGSKIREYEGFIDMRLKVDLDKIIQARDNYYNQIAKYLELKNNITLLQENRLQSIKSMVNLGCEFYIQANVPDITKVFVNIGLGFHAELTLQEALSFIEIKEKSLSKYVEKLTQQECMVKAKIKLMYQGLNELKNVEQV